MKRTFKRMLYGGDYNPNQWPWAVWDEDMRMFRHAGINSVTINVFSWAKLQPSEEEYHFEELDEIVEILSRNDYDIVMATSTAALPAWMVSRYTEVARTDYEGRHHRFGQRHNACPNSPVYQKYAAALVEKLAIRYGSNEKIICWHVNNEYGGECYCDNCEKAFRFWLKQKYKTIEAVNKAWSMEFWGHTLYDWNEIVLPNALSEGIGDDKTAFAGISIDYRRFNSDSMLGNYKMERDIIRKHNLKALITTNLMGTYKGLDYFKWAKEMDIVAWDNYPRYDTPWSYTAMCHDLMRGLKEKPFMLMEQTPSQQNWQEYNSLKKPGQMRAQSYQTIAHGGDTIQFFQLRRSVGACEKFHGAVIGHVGSENTRVFREVTQLGRELEELGGKIIGADTASSVGILFDWDNYWALEYTSGPNKNLKYVDQIHQYYRYFYNKNISADMISIDADFNKYQIVVAPVLYMVKEGVARNLEEYIQRGGILVTGFMSGIVDQSDNVYLGGYPGPFRELSGIWVEEIDALDPEQSNDIIFTDGTTSNCEMLCDIIHTEGAESIADYSSNFYAGMPAVTRNSFGKGQTFYIGTVLEEAALSKVMDIVTSEAGVKSVFGISPEVEVTIRQTQTQYICFIMNFHKETKPVPEFFVGKQDVLSKRILSGEDMMKQYDVCIVIHEK